MTGHDAAALAQRFNDAFNARDWDAAAALTAPDATFVNAATGETFHGPAGALQFLSGWATAFPEAQVETTNLVAGGDGAAIEFIGRGVHAGPLKTPLGEIPATGRSAEVHFCSVLRAEGGQIRENRLYFDVAGLLLQLGVMLTR